MKKKNSLTRVILGKNNGGGDWWLVPIAFQHKVMPSDIHMIFIYRKTQHDNFVLLYVYINTFAEKFHFFLFELLLSPNCKCEHNMYVFLLIWQFLLLYMLQKYIYSTYNDKVIWM